MSLGSAIGFAAGVTFVGAAALTSNAVIERALLGSASGALSWGPALFRSLLAFHGMLLIAWSTGSRSWASRSAAPPAPHEAPSSRAWWLLGALSCLALALRVWRLDSCLWYDEVVTLVEFARNPLGQIVTSFPSQNQHMLYSVLAHASIAVFGESAWTLRLPAVLFGIASLWALFLLGRRILGEREALLGCALMAVSYHHVWFSQNSRGYMPLLFFATFCTWLWLEASARNTWRSWLFYSVAVALGMWTHLTLVFVVVTHAFLSTVEAGVRRFTTRRAVEPSATGSGPFWRACAALMLAGTLTLQLYALSLPEFLRSGLHEVSVESEWTNPLWVVRESFHGLRMSFGAGAVVLGGLLTAALGWGSLLLRDWRAGLSLVLPPILAGSTMLALGHNIWPRFFFFSMGFALLIAVHGAIELPRVVARLLPRSRLVESLTPASGLALVVAMIVVSALSLPRCYALPKQDFVGARDFIERLRQPGDPVVAVGLAGYVYPRYFAPDWIAVDSESELDALRAAHPRLWLVYTLSTELKAYRPEIWKAIDDEFDVVRVFPGTLNGGDVSVCRTRS